MVVKNGTKKTFEVFFSSKHASRKLLYSLCLSTYMKMVSIILYYGPVSMFFVQEGVRVPFTILVKFLFLNYQFLLLALSAKIAIFQMQITKKNTIVRYYLKPS